MSFFSVVIDYAYNPRASTGKFECLYRTPTLTPIRYGVNDLEVIGVALPLDYFYKGKIEVEEFSYTSNIIDKQRDINKMLKKLKTMYESDIMKVPDCDDYLNNLDKEKESVNKTHSDDLLEDENNNEQVDELIVDKITSDQSISSKRVSECQNSTSISSINLLKKCYKSKSAANVTLVLKKSLSKCTSSTACKVPFFFSKLDDGSDGKISPETLFQKDPNRPGPSNYTAHDRTKHLKDYVQSNININKSLHKLLDNEVVTELEGNIHFTKNKQTVQDITKKIFDFLEMKENEYINS